MNCISCQIKDDSVVHLIQMYFLSYFMYETNVYSIAHAAALVFDT